MRVTESLFPTAISIITDIDLGVADEIFAYTDWVKHHHTSPNSHASRNITFLDDFPEVRDRVEGELNLFASQVYSCPVPLRLTTSWLTLTQPNGWSHYHFHSNSFYSGVWYPTDSSPICFLRPSPDRQLAIPLVPDGPFSHDAYTIQPTANTMVLFPSYLKHSVTLTNESRRSLAFNSFPVGSFGADDSTLTVF